MAFEPVFESANLLQKVVASSQVVVEARMTPSGGSNIVKVLSITSDICVTPSEKFAGEVRFSGRVDYHVMYLDGDNRCKCIEYSSAFSDKIACPNINVNSRIALSGKILDTATSSVSPSELRLASVTEISATVFAENTTQYMCKAQGDIYTSEDKTTFAKIISQSIESVTMEEMLKEKGIADVLSCEGRAVIENYKTSLDCMVVDGGVKASVTCQMENGLIKQYELSIPFHHEMSALNTRNEHSMYCVASLESVKTHFERDGEYSTMRVTAIVGLNGFSFGEDSMTPVIDVFSAKNELTKNIVNAPTMTILASKVAQDSVEGSLALTGELPIADNILSLSGITTAYEAKLMEGKLVVEGVLSGNIVYFSSETSAITPVAFDIPYSLSYDGDGAEDIMCNVMPSVTTAKIRRGTEIEIRATLVVTYLMCKVEEKCVITSIKLGEERIAPTSAFGIHIVKSGQSLWDVCKSLCATPEVIMSQNPALEIPLHGGERVMCYRHLSQK